MFWLLTVILHLHTRTLFTTQLLRQLWHTYYYCYKNILCVHLFHRIIVVLVFVSTAVVTAGHVMSHDLVSNESSGKQVGFQHNLYKLFHID